MSNEQEPKDFNHKLEKEVLEYFVELRKWDIKMKPIKTLFFMTVIGVLVWSFVWG